MDTLQCGDSAICGRVYGHDGAGCGAWIKEWRMGKMSRHDEIKNAYKSLGGEATF